MPMATCKEVIWQITMASESPKSRFINNTFTLYLLKNSNTSDFLVAVSTLNPNSVNESLSSINVYTSASLISMVALELIKRRYK